MLPPVLFVDDSAVARAAATKRLRELGLDVTVLGGAREAAAVDPTAFVAALLDLELGDGLGTDVASHLRKGQGGLPIAFFTSTRTPEVIAVAKQFGPVFAKPAELDQAIDWVRRHGR